MLRMRSSDSATLIFLLAALMRFANGMHCIILHTGPASREAKCKRQNFASHGTAWKHESRRAEVMALFLSDVLLLPVIGFCHYKTKRNFLSSYLEDTRHVIYLGVTCWRSILEISKIFIGLNNFDLRVIVTSRRLPLVWNHSYFGE